MNLPMRGTTALPRPLEKRRLLNYRENTSPRVGHKYWCPPRRKTRGCRGRDRMIVWFTTTTSVSAYYHWCCEFESRSGRGAQHFVIVCQWLAKGRLFSASPPVSTINKADHHDITAILLKVVLNTIHQKKTYQNVRKLYVYITLSNKVT